MLDNELNKLVDSLGQEELSDEEIEQLKQEAIKMFDALDGVEFKEGKDDKEKLSNDFNTCRQVLTKNVDRVEKLTALLFNNIAMQPDNQFLIGNAISVISEQNKQIKLLGEIANKNLVNKQLATKLNEPEDGKNNKKGLPPGLDVEK